MLTEERIRQLQALDGLGARVLSVYLDLDPASQVWRTYRVAFEDLVKDLGERLAERDRKELSAEASTVQAWLESQEPRGLGLTVFSCTPRTLWHAEFLAVRVRNHLAFGPSPDVAPLLEIMDEHERYAVIVVDKVTARLFTVFAGEIEEQAGFRDELTVAGHDQGGLSESRDQRHHDTRVYGHLKRVAQRLVEIHRRRPFDRLIVAGPEEAATEFRRLLPRALAHRVTAVVRGETLASEQALLEKTLEIERRIERETEDRLLALLVDMAGPGGRASLGVGPTLAALWADMVQTLVLSHGRAVSGSACPNCLRLDQGSVGSCPACGHATRPVHDLVHRAMARAVEQSASVEVLHGAAARRLMDLGAGMGALLRYPSPVPQVVAAAAKGTGHR
jgi:peptide chain release factor subunit 1